MSKAVVSIITPAYNCSKTIRFTFNSIFAQSFPDWEWIIIDDCSSDKTLEVLKLIEKSDQRVRVLQTRQNGGAAVARNVGINAATGRYIAFLDSDDTWNSDKLEKQLSFMTKNKCSFSCTNYKVVRDGKKEFFYRPKKKIVTYKNLLKTCTIGCLTVIYDTKTIGKVLMPIDAPKREDHATWIDITKKGYNCFRVNECLATYNLKDNSVSSNKFHMFKYQYIMYRRHLHFSPVKSFLYTCLVSFNKIFRKYR